MKLNSWDIAILKILVEEKLATNPPRPGNLYDENLKELYARLLAAYAKPLRRPDESLPTGHGSEHF